MIKRPFAHLVQQVAGATPRASDPPPCPQPTEPHLRLPTPAQPLITYLLGLDPREAWHDDIYHHANGAVTELIWNEACKPEVIRLADVGELKQVR